MGWGVEVGCFRFAMAQHPSTFRAYTLPYRDHKPEAAELATNLGRKDVTSLRTRLIELGREYIYLHSAGFVIYR